MQTVTPTRRSRNNNRYNSPGMQKTSKTPPIVTPIRGKPSWEDFDEGIYAAHRGTRKPGSSSPGSFRTTDTSACTSFEDDDMPMDEFMASSRSSLPSSDRSVEITDVVASPPTTDSNIGRIIRALQTHDRPSHLTLEERMLWDAIQTSVSQARMLRNSTPAARETQLEQDLAKAKQELQLLKLQDGPELAAPPTMQRLAQLQEQLKSTKAEMKTKDEEHDVQLRAIQRVLAELTAEREEETQAMQKQIDSLTQQLQTAKSSAGSKAVAVSPPPPPPPARRPSPPAEKQAPLTESARVEELKNTIKEMEADQAASKKELDRKARRLLVLERDYRIAKGNLQKAQSGKLPKDTLKLSVQVDSLKAEVEDLKERNHKLVLEMEAKESRKPPRKTSMTPPPMTPPRPGTPTDNESVCSALSQEEVESLQKNLVDTHSSLENAKKIIASLENANGSMAVDLRAKLKAKEEELTMVQTESAERKRRLDSLATELRDLQRKTDTIERFEKQSNAQMIRHKALMGLLENSLNGLQSASAVHEVATSTGQPDPVNMDKIGEILTDTLVGIRTSINLTEQYLEEFDDNSTVAMTEVDVSSEVGRQIDSIIKSDREALAKSMKDELEQKRVTVRRLEETIKKQNEELKQLRLVGSSGDNQRLLDEIQSLREQCSTNMEVLAKKERELSVLRSSLKVDENDAGYISDDASEGDEDDDDDAPVVPAGLKGYDPAQTEALATLMASGGKISSGKSDWKDEYVKALEEREKASKELQAERDSLANAKLIISSLEKANKSMMEDLRSRLQDSNTAIASLLEKSMEHEKNSLALQEEVSKLKKEKAELEKEHLTQIGKAKDTAKVHSLRALSKDRELSDLRRDAEGKSIEEKKEDVV
eukprot:Nitzschia sp. Nitz4//scaffold42_size132992//49569//52208//NITZ4_003392-RA/size132992-processed-gene-0.30-mRNA-1//-1//CDS//3329551697//3727//frame0